MSLPPHVKSLAEACQLEVIGWETDSDDALVRGEDVNYVGTHGEVIAYLTAWQQCIGLKVKRELLADDGDRVMRGIIGIDSGTVIFPDQTADLVARPYVSVFRGDWRWDGERVAISHRLAQHFDIVDIKVGNKSCLLTSAPVPALAFAIGEGSLVEYVFTQQHNQIEVIIAKSALYEFGRALSMPTLMTAMDLTFLVRNTSDAPHRFQAVVLGKYGR